MGYSFFIARRLSLSSRHGKNSPAIRVATIAVALSVIVMVFAIAIVLGFKREIRNKIIGFNDHITLFAQGGESGTDNLVSLNPTLRNILDSQKYITDYSLQASIPAILKTSDNFKGVYLKSLEGASIRNFISQNLVSGKMPDYTNGNSQKILISQLAADKLGLKTGDKIDTYFMSGSVKMRRLEIAGIFNSHFDSYDDIFIYGALPLIQKLGNVKGTQGTSISIQTDNFDNLDYNSFTLQQTLDEALVNGLLYRPYRVENAKNQGAGYFSWLSLLDTNVIVILVLMTIVACATLISGMLIIILDKKRFIGLMKTMGATSRSIQKIFILLALKISIRGLLIGNLISLSLLYVQDKYHLIPLDAESYYIDFVPVEINNVAIILLNVATLVIIYLSLILPSSFVSKISPAEIVKYE